MWAAFAFGRHDVTKFLLMNGYPVVASDYNNYPEARLQMTQWAEEQLEFGNAFAELVKTLGIRGTGAAGTFLHIAEVRDHVASYAGVPSTSQLKSIRCVKSVMDEAAAKLAGGGEAMADMECCLSPRALSPRSLPFSPRPRDPRPVPNHSSQAASPSGQRPQHRGGGTNWLWYAARAVMHR
mmetsp:Transcript_40279/g.92482  ORF Transcript_40279/g.92482 Transcript_40279/m.92482 type:complete len:181 (-) Transcript_40279:89-631(-)